MTSLETNRNIRFLLNRFNVILQVPAFVTQFQPLISDRMQVIHLRVVFAPSFQGRDQRKIDNGINGQMFRIRTI